MDMDMDIGSADMGIVEVKVEFWSTVDVAVVALLFDKLSEYRRSQYVLAVQHHKPILYTSLV
jgi:hypothetical protein